METAFVLLLHSVPHLGEKAMGRLLRLASQNRLQANACLKLSAEEWQERYELHPRSAEYLARHGTALLAKSAELARLLRAHPFHILTQESASYPQALERYDESPPPILYALGRLSLLEPETAGSRFLFTLAASNEAEEDPGALARQDAVASLLIEAGGVPVTGHDRLPYQRLALSAQRRNRPILYVLDRGLREALGPEFDRPPFAAARIREAVFLPERDLALSSFRLDDHGLGANNRRRDRIIFSLAQIVVAVAVRSGGGMMRECLRARSQGRPVFVVEAGNPGAGELLAAGGVPLPEEAGAANATLATALALSAEGREPNL